MATATRVLFFMGLVISLVSVASAISGTATYYNVYVREYSDQNIHIYKTLNMFLYI
jgi:hypothetical protein